VRFKCGIKLQERKSVTVESGAGSEGTQGEGSAEAAVDVEIVTTGTAAECTESNQHIVTGAYDMLEQLRQVSNGRMLRRQAELCNVLFLLTFEMLRYDPMVRTL
jgi:hypothetical protein